MCKNKKQFCNTYSDYQKEPDHAELKKSNLWIKYSILVISKARNFKFNQYFKREHYVSLVYFCKVNE